MGRFSVISWTSSGCEFFISVGLFLVLEGVCSLVWCLIQFNDLFRSSEVFLVTCCCKFWADVRGFYWSPLLAASQPLCVYVCVCCVCVCCRGLLLMLLVLLVLLGLIQFNDLFRSWCLVQFIVVFDTVYCGV